MKKFTLLFVALCATLVVSAETITLQMADLAATSGTLQGVEITTAKNNGQTAPSFNTSAKDLRIYAKGSITIKYTEDMQEINFTVSNKGKYRLAPLTANTGACVVKGDPDFTAVWNGLAKEVTITVGDQADFGTDGSEKAGQLCIDAITITTVASAVRNIEMDNTVFANAGRIYCEETARIYNLTGMDVTRMNGNLEGVYIVKNGNKLAKVVVRK